MQYKSCSECPHDTYAGCGRGVESEREDFCELRKGAFKGCIECENNEYYGCRNNWEEEFCPFIEKNR